MTEWKCLPPSPPRGAAHTLLLPPYDGEEVVLFGACPGGEPQVRGGLVWDNFIGAWANADTWTSDIDGWTATHWHPMPPPPSS